MKALARHYALALSALPNPADGAAGLARILRKKGHIELLPSILSEFRKLRREKMNESGTNVRVRRLQDFKQLESSIKACAGKSGFDVENARIVEDPFLVGGFAIERDGFEIDKSHRRALIALYRRLSSVAV